MTKAEFVEGIEQMFDGVNAELIKQTTSFLLSGAEDISEANTLLVAKVFMCVFLENMASTFEPRSDMGITMKKNIEKFI